MYCGDETGSFIGEIGSGTCKFGYGGEDNPKLVLPSYVSSSTTKPKHMSTSSLRYDENERLESILRMPEWNDDGSEEAAGSRPLTDPCAFLRQGDMVENWDNLQTAWETSMEMLRATDTMKHTKGGTPYKVKATGGTTTSSGGITSTNIASTEASSSSEGKCIHPLLAVTPGFTQFYGYGRDYCAALKREQYVKYTELLMESLDATSMFLAPAPMLACFSVGRQTALMVDLGAGGCRVTPIVDGLVLQHSQRRNGRGGDWLGNITWKAFLEETKVSPKPRYLLRGKSKDSMAVQSLFHRRAINDLMYEARTQPFITLYEMEDENIRIPFSKPSKDFNPSPPNGSPPDSPSSVNGSPMSETQYQLPDGTCVDLSTSFGKDLAQLPELLFADTLPFESSLESQNLLPTMSNAPLHKLVHESLLAVGDVDVRKDLAGCICLTGSTSLFPNVETRLSQELSNILPSFVKPKVLASRISVERSCASWIGGSILTSLGSFQQLWLSRTEYEEYGPTMAIQRFP